MPGRSDESLRATARGIHPFLSSVTAARLFATEGPCTEPATERERAMLVPGRCVSAAHLAPPKPFCFQRETLGWIKAEILLVLSPFPRTACRLHRGCVRAFGLGWRRSRVGGLRCARCSRTGKMIRRCGRDPHESYSFEMPRLLGRLGERSQAVPREGLFAVAVPTRQASRDRSSPRAPKNRSQARDFWRWRGPAGKTVAPGSPSRNRELAAGLLATPQVTEPTPREWSVCYREADLALAVADFPGQFHSLDNMPTPSHNEGCLLSPCPGNMSCPTQPSPTMLIRTQVRSRRRSWSG